MEIHVLLRLSPAVTELRKHARITLVNSWPGLKNDLKKLALFFPFLRPEEIQKMGRFRLALQTVTRNNASICSGSHYFETHNYLKNRWGPNIPLRKLFLRRADSR